MKDDATQPEMIFQGLGVSRGIGIGVVHLRDSDRPDVPEYTVPLYRISEELIRFEKAVEASKSQIAKLQRKAEALHGAAAEELGFLLEAHLQMLKGSRLVRGVETVIREQNINAEAAVQQVLAEISKGFAALEDVYIASRQSDIHQVADRLLRNLTDTPSRPFANLPVGSVIIAEELTPADTALMDPKKVAGFATVLGGPESHTAIMARALGLPAVLGAAEVVSKAKNGDRVIIDGDHGRVVINPSEETLADYETRKLARIQEDKRLSRLREKPAVTLDGVHVALEANVELPIEIDAVRNAGAEGVGLLRSEFMFMNRKVLPSEDEQYETFRTIIEAMDGRPVTIRTLDVGGDKIDASLIEDFGDSIKSALGMRGIRLTLNRIDILETQFAAMLRAAVHGPIRILLPMVTTVHEIRKARQIAYKVSEDLEARGIELPRIMPPIGAMIEVPGAALSADALAQVCDFFAIGSNDLTMYTLAVDRADEQVAHLYDQLNPSVLRLIQFATEAALRARIPVSLCGEMAGNPRYSALLLGLGIRDLSMGAGNMLRVKQRLMNLDSMAARQRAHAIMEQVDAGRISMLLDDFNSTMMG